MSGHVSRAELIETISRVAAVEDFESMRSVIADCRRLLERLLGAPAKQAYLSRHGTHHFTTIAAADAYYRKQGYTTDEVIIMVSEGEIAIGRPAFVPKGSTVEAADDGRYFITSQSFE